jgi:heptose-I-phosphate ethanolaminephosphotransferase
MIFPQKIRKYVRWLVLFITYSLAIIDIFCVEKFQAKIGPEILNVILETNPREASEFVDNYINIGLLYSGIGLIIILLGFHIVSAHYADIIEEAIKKSLYSYSRKVKHIIILVETSCLLAIIVSFYFCIGSRIKLFKLMTTYTTEEADNYISNFSENTPFNNLLFSIKMRQIANRGLVILRNTQDGIKVDSCSYTSNQIVLIIGESYIKCHSQLYYYQLPTTPRQLSHFKTSETGCLIPFTNVISPSNLTSTVFKNIFSLKSIDNKDNWAFYPLFPVLFRKAGFQVSFISNQFVKKLNSDIFNFSGGLFINDDKLSKAQFDHRNTNTHQFDIGLLSDYDSLSVFQSEHQLTIFHLAGQHIDFEKRSPSEMKVFSPSDYNFRNNLNETAKQLVADYDNATYYNDYVVDSIIKKFEDKDAIVIYMPDHGEECFDELQRMGRLPHGNYSPEVLRQEYQIPFWIWCSSEYIDNHPIIFEQIKKAYDRPFMTDDLPHLLLYLAGIHCDYYIDSKCLISDRFNLKRKRMINNTANFDDIIRKQ